MKATSQLCRSRCAPGIKGSWLNKLEPDFSRKALPDYLQNAVHRALQRSAVAWVGGHTTRLVGQWIYCGDLNNGTGKEPASAYLAHCCRAR